MKNITAIFQKQVKDTLKNKTILIQFVMFPFLTIIMENAIKIDNMPENFFVKMFATMYIGMAPLTSMAIVIAEEKECNTLRVLLMSKVKPMEYLVGVGSYIWLFCMMGASVFAVVGAYHGKEFWIFMAVMAIGILASMLMGAAIGTWSKGQMMATSLAVPCMMVFAFLPMISMFNETVEKIARFAYSQAICEMLERIGSDWQIEGGNIVVICANIAAALVFFLYSYKKSGLA